MIPKIVHYCWFGGNEYPENVNLCMKTWEENLKLKGYKFMRWDEKNSPLDNGFVKQALNDKKWAFVSDFVRVYALVKYGGIYLDTDMLLVKGLDKFLENESFLGFEDQGVPSCGIIGAKKNHDFWEEVLEIYKSIDHKYDYSTNTIPKVVKRHVLKKYGQSYLSCPTSTFMLYPVDYFYPMPYFAKESPFSYVTNNTYAIHLWNSSWLTLLEKADWNWRNGFYNQGIKLVLTSIKEAPENIKGYQKLSFYIFHKLLFKLVKIKELFK